MYTGPYVRIHEGVPVSLGVLKGLDHPEAQLLVRFMGTVTGTVVSTAQNGYNYSCPTCNYK